MQIMFSDAKMIHQNQMRIKHSMQLDLLATILFIFRENEHRLFVQENQGLLP